MTVDLDEVGDPKSGNFNGSTETPVNLVTEATDVPAKEEKGCGGIISNSAAVVAVMAAVVFLKKRRR